ncbi:MAG: InlB B-repeat-containing protein [Mycoplasmoidaceae bacterium]
MKKLKITLFSLVATINMPFIGLVSCKSNQPVNVNPHIYFNNNGHGTITGDLDIEVKKGTRWCDLVAAQKLPKHKADYGYVFDGWFDKDGKELNDSDKTVINSNFTVTGIFSQIVSICTVTFDLGQGWIEGLTGNTVEVKKGTLYAQLPTPTWFNHLFANWKVGGSIKYPTDLINSDVTVTASYIDNPPPTNLTITGGNTSLSSHSWEDGYDNQKWKFKQGEEVIKADSWNLVPIGESKIDEITIDDEQIVRWSQWMTAGTYQFRVRVVYKNWEIFSDPITLTIENYDFRLCDWSVVVDVCNKFENGDINEEQFCKYFTLRGLENSNEQTFQPSSFDDFIGQARFVHINGIHHTTIVVGCQQDVFWNPSSTINKPVALTFQFTNLISNNDGAYIPTKWGENTNFDYWRSTLYHFLNDEGDGQNSVYLMIAADEYNAGLVEEGGIKDVRRIVNGGSPGSWAPIASSAKLFCPSLSNFFSKTGMEATDDSVIPSIDVDKYCAEGQQYAYYKNNGIEDAPIQAGGVLNKFPCLVFYDNNHQRNGVWISTPYLQEYNSSWFVNYLGDYSSGVSKVFVNNEFAVVPCFCV